MVETPPGIYFRFSHSLACFDPLSMLFTCDYLPVCLQHPFIVCVVWQILLEALITECYCT